MGKWGHGLKVDFVATKQRTGHFNLAQEFYSAQPSSSRKLFDKSAFFHNFASFQVSKCPLYGKMGTGA